MMCHADCCIDRLPTDHVDSQLVILGNLDSVFTKQWSKIVGSRMKKSKKVSMSEIVGDLWDYYNKDRFVICILTNGTVKNGKAVMGKGCALECKKHIPAAPEILARILSFYGNIVCRLPYPESGILTFPTKHNYWEKADLKLIEQSALDLKKYARTNPDCIFILPRPGCGAGKLEWSQVKKCLLKVGFPANVWIISKG